MPPGSSVFEEQRVGVAQVEHHHRVGDRGFGHVDAGLGDNDRRVGRVGLGFVGLEHDIGGGLLVAFGAPRLGGGIVAVLDPALVAAQLLLDLVGRAIERHVRVMGNGVALEDQALHHMGDDIAAECALRSLAEGDVRGQRAGEILVDDRAQPGVGVPLERGAGLDLMSRYANVHGLSPSVVRAAPGCPARTAGQRVCSQIGA